MATSFYPSPQMDYAFILTLEKQAYARGFARSAFCETIDYSLQCEQVSIVMRLKRIRLLLIVLASVWLASCIHQNNAIIAFEKVNLIPMTSETVMENQTVLIMDGEIQSIGNTGDLRIPWGAQVIDGQGAYLMPGLADMHMHTRADWEDPQVWPVHPLRLYLANGVTSIRDMSPQGSPLTYALQWRKEIRDGERIGPTIYASGRLLYASPLNNAPGVVQQNHEAGFDFLKLYSYLSQEDFAVAIQAANDLEMYTTGHIPYAVGLEGALAANMDEIAHVEELLPEFFKINRDQQLSPEAWLFYLAQTLENQIETASHTMQADFEKHNAKSLAAIAAQLKAEEVPVCTTMVVDDVIQQKLFATQTFLSRPENIYFETGYLETFQHGEEKHQVQCRGIENLCATKYVIDHWLLRGLHDANVLLLLGTDSGTGGMGILPGFSIHDELQILVDNGFTPYEAIAAGTINAAIVADRMTGEGNFSSIKVGNRADLLQMQDNPLKDIATVQEPLYIMASGKLYTSEELITFQGDSK
jgi:imidazolonepropionase-like amidohydrolase